MHETEHIVMPADHMEELYQARNPLVRFAHRQRIEKITQCVAELKASRILDAGCGEGHLLALIKKRLPGAETFGSDIIEVALEHARVRSPDSTFVTARISEMPFADGYFDAITCTEVLEHVYDYREALKEFRRLIRPGGYLIVTFPNEPVWTASRFLLGRRPVKVPDHVNSFTPGIMARDAGLTRINQLGLPFGLPFLFSLGYLMIFQKEINN
ncbi:MAG: class I SAM-dependent methyltransferase [bacterium]